MPATEPRIVQVIVDVTQKECPWLGRTYKAGEVLWTFHGPTYGCIDEDRGIALSEKPGEWEEFFEFPWDALGNPPRNLKRET
jgi:hypothetical protein